jgi:hypothetical protein
MRPLILTPCFECVAGMRQRAKRFLIQQLIPEPVVDAFDYSPLARLAGCDVVPCDMMFVGPAPHRIGSQFDDIVRDGRHELAAMAEHRLTPE